VDVIGTSIRHPVSTFSAVILVLIFGLLGLSRLPVQLTPDVEAPTISITTNWFGASPYEIEKEIIEKQEDVLKSIAELVSMESASQNNRGQITLTFKVGADLQTALSRVSNKLNEVSDYPANAARPQISASGAQSSPVIWMMLKVRGADKARINQYRSFFENEIRGRLERVPGVGSLFVLGGTETRMEVVVDAGRLAANGLTLNALAAAVNAANSNVSAGVLGLEKRNYRVRTVGQFQRPDDLGEVLLADDGRYRVYLRDVAETRLGYAPQSIPVRHNGTPIIVVAVRKESGANVLEMTDAMQRTVGELNAGELKRAGLYIDWVYDQRPYINNAIDQVQRNLLIGASLAIIVLWLYLRSIAATLTVAMAIPISVFSTFIFLLLFERTINVVSLAGISFAVGMLVDNAIVVLENIDRHRRMGKSAFAASHDGAREVWGAVLASTVTTVAVFLPVLFVEEQAGQLFRDIAIAITFAIVVSLFVSVSVIPAITRKLYQMAGRERQASAVTVAQGNWFVRSVMALSRLTLKNAFSRLLTVGLLMAAAAWGVMLLLPKAEYLPQGNRNLIINIMVPPPGYSEAKREEIADYVYAAIRPHIEEDGIDGVPQVKSMFFVASEQLTLFGGTSVHDQRAREMMPLFTRVMNSIPGMFGVSIQQGIFSQSLGRDRSVDINISGSDNAEIVAAARALFVALKDSELLGGAQIRPVPSLEISYPEVRLIPDRARLIANGLSERELGFAVDVLMDGRKIGEFKPDGEKVMDLVLTARSDAVASPEDILDGLVATREGRALRIGDLAELQYARGMTQINHLERARTVRLEVTPPGQVALQEAIEYVQQQVLPGVRESGALEAVRVSIGGSADKLSETRQALQWNFILAVLIIYLLMASLFGHFLYPLVILLSIPLAAAGGFVGLALVDRFIAAQPFDILVMLGFVILVGTVVNNAILIVHQSLNNVRYQGLLGVDAVLYAVRTRIRPIFMSTTTSVFGLLPLVLATGSGSELYRGLGSVILGGLAVSTVFTLFVIPALLAFVIGREKPRAAAAAGSP